MDDIDDLGRPTMATDKKIHYNMGFFENWRFILEGEGKSERNKGKWEKEIFLLKIKTTSFQWGEGSRVSDPIVGFLFYFWYFSTWFFLYLSFGIFERKKKQRIKEKKGREEKGKKIKKEK